jgi:hypothetical protein
MIDTINLLLLIHLKFQEIGLAKNILKSVDFSLSSFQPNDATHIIAGQIGEKIKYKNNSE